jgi:hypothetical protein
MNVLVITSETIGGAELRDAFGTDVDPSDIEVMVVAPALQEGPLKFWLSDADDAIARADQVRRETLERLGNDGVPATANTGESDPMAAIIDALRTFSADRIVLFTHPEGDERYREDLDPDEIERRFGVPVDRAVVRSG